MAKWYKGIFACLAFTVWATLQAWNDIDKSFHKIQTWSTSYHFRADTTETQSSHAGFVSQRCVGSQTAHYVKNLGYLEKITGNILNFLQDIFFLNF